MAYMYILGCSDGTSYVGNTVDLDRRLAQHAAGEGAHYTRHRLPVRLLYFEEGHDIEQAFLREKQVQGWGRAKRDALIEGRAGDLPSLSKKVQPPREIESPGPRGTESPGPRGIE